jgi:pimeloyl-ACP methyl ester carboxylesterase
MTIDTTQSTTTGITTSADGTALVYDQVGQGPAVVMLQVGPFTRSLNAGLAALLCDEFTVYTYDRRGHGDSGGSVEDGPDREFEDLSAILDLAGGHAHVYGSSGAGILGLHAAARGVSIDRLAVWEPPYYTEPGLPRPPADWGQQVARMVAAERRGDAVAFWLTAVVGMPEEFVEGMRQAPFWAGQEAGAHHLVADHALVGDQELPAELLGSITVPTLVLDGGSASYPPMSTAAPAVAAAVPGAQHRHLDGQPHNVADDAMADALHEFFGPPTDS